MIISFNTIKNLQLTIGYNVHPKVRNLKQHKMKVHSIPNFL